MWFKMLQREVIVRGQTVLFNFFSLFVTADHSKEYIGEFLFKLDPLLFSQILFSHLSWEYYNQICTFMLQLTDLPNNYSVKIRFHA